MVLQKKGAAAAAKNAQNKKKGKPVFEEQDDDSDMLDMEDMDDDDFDDSDSEEEAVVQKTPQNKTPKGKQSLSEKKVSFQIPGNNTPAKTPNKNASFLAKKTPTPGGKGKTGVQEFKGMKGKNTPSKQDEDDDDDDDDDDDEDDEDDLEDFKLGDDDDEDDDDEDDDEDDDDDDDDDDDEDEDEDGEASKNIQKKLSMLKQKSNQEQNKQKTPKVEKSKSVETPKEASPQKKEKQSSNKTLSEMPAELERRRTRDAKMLYIGNLPKDVTAKEVKALSSDILDVIMPNSNRQNKNRQQRSKFAFAFLVFESEKKAVENHSVLQSKKFRGQLVNVDFVGEKSQNKKPSASDNNKELNLKKLFISGIPLDATVAQVAKFYPKSYQVTFNLSAEFRTAFVLFATQEDANEAYESTQGAEVDGQKMIVLHAVQNRGNKKHNRKRSRGPQNNAGNKAKRMKTEEN